MFSSFSTNPDVNGDEEAILKVTKESYSYRLHNCTITLGRDAKWVRVNEDIFIPVHAIAFAYIRKIRPTVQVLQLRLRWKEQKQYPPAVGGFYASPQVHIVESKPMSMEEMSIFLSKLTGFSIGACP